MKYTKDSTIRQKEKEKWQEYNKNKEFTNNLRGKCLVKEF